MQNATPAANSKLHASSTAALSQGSAASLPPSLAPSMSSGSVSGLNSATTSGQGNLQRAMASRNSELGSSLAPASSRSPLRVVLVVSSDLSLRERLRRSLSGLRWQVLETGGGAEAWSASENSQFEALLIDPWLPDLDVSEFLRDFHSQFPSVDLMRTDGAAVAGSPRSPYHQELLYALRSCQDVDTAAWNLAPSMRDRPARGGQENAGFDRGGLEAPPLPELSRVNAPAFSGTAPRAAAYRGEGESTAQAGRGQTGTVQAGTVQAGATHVGPVHVGPAQAGPVQAGPGQVATAQAGPAYARTAHDGPATGAAPLGTARVQRDLSGTEPIPELIGVAPVMLEISRRIRLVAARTTPVLIEGPTGSGKELVAEALHRLSTRSRKPFVAINCAAIPESLLEAELFGHTRGAFTGAVQGRIGRIEAADGGTLFLDEIGEMPLPLQSKLLRFFESGELQRVGDNETIKVDVRIVAATHQALAENAQKGIFRADLYYRLAVFLVRTPALIEHMEDLPLLVSHFMAAMGRSAPVKRIDGSAMAKLEDHGWPGNVRELEHVLERAAILAGDEPMITAAEIDFGLAMMN